MVEELEGGGQWRRSVLEKIVAEVDQGATGTYPGGLLKFLLLVQRWIRYGRTSGLVCLHRRFSSHSHRLWILPGWDFCFHQLGFRTRHFRTTRKGWISIGWDSWFESVSFVTVSALFGLRGFLGVTVFHSDVSPGH